MPTYEYRCKDCGHEFEAVQAFTDDAITDCPACGGTVKKRFGNVGIAFKGSGFYKNDARSSSSKASSSGSAEPASSTSISSDSSTSSSSSGSDSTTSSSSSSSSSSAGTGGSGSTATTSA